MGTLQRGVALAVFLGTVWVGLAQATNPVPGAPVTPQDPGLAAPIPADSLTPAPAQPATTTPQEPLADINKPAPVPKKAVAKKKPAAPALPSAKGEVLSLDRTNMTVSIRAKDGEQTFKVTSKTRIFSEAKPAIFGDGAVGDQAAIEYRKAKDGGASEALTLRFSAKK